MSDGERITGPRSGHGQQRVLQQPQPLLRAAPAGQDLFGGTVASYLVGVRQFTAFLQPHGQELPEATRADLEGSSPDS
jgi:hypothetical protein